jgi:hypothetical protein
MIWIDYHNKFFNFKPLADEALLNKLVDEAVKTDEFRKFRYFNIGGGDRACYFWRPLVRYSYDNFNNPAPHTIEIYGYDIKQGYRIDFKTKKRILEGDYFSFYALKSLLHFKFKHNIPYYGTEFFSTPFHWIEEDPSVYMYEKYKDNPDCKDYKKYGHIGKVAEISIVDDRLKNLEFIEKDDDYDDFFYEFSKRRRFAALRKALNINYPSAVNYLGNKCFFFLSDSEVLDRIESANPDISLRRDLTQEQYFAEREKYSIINPSDKFFRQFCVKFIARLIALDLGYFICKYNYDICEFLQFNKVSKVSYTVNLFEFDIRTFSHPRAQEVFKVIIKEVVKYLIEIFTNRAFINFEMDDFKFEYVDVEIFPGIKITDPLGKSFVIRFDFWNMSHDADNYNNNYVGYGSIKNIYEDTYPSKVCGVSSDYYFTLWSPVASSGIWIPTPYEIGSSSKSNPKFEWLLWRDYVHMLYNRFLGAYYHKEPVGFNYSFDSVEEDMSFMRECFENYLLKYLESTGNCEQYFDLKSGSSVVNRSWFYGRRNLSISQVSFLDVPAPAGFMSFNSTKLAVGGSTTVCDHKARERFNKYHMELFIRDNFYEFK